ncbi:MAG: hypothetical protein ABJA02_06275 [Acidobacteriota bacterium]
MTSKQANMPIDPNKAYEANEIGLKGIVWFGVGLLLLIVITFVLIWSFLYTLRDYSAENAGPANPMAMTDKEKLPPEPRLQAAPGFGVDSPDGGRVNLELMGPHSEYIELKKQWDEVQRDGRSDAKTGMVTVMPIDEAKKKFLESNVKARSGPDAEKALQDSRMFVSDSSAGRMAGETRR